MALTLGACSGAHHAATPEPELGLDAGSATSGSVPDPDPTPGSGPKSEPDLQPEVLLQGGPGPQAVPHLAARADGTAWLSWYTADSESGQWSIRLQRIDSTGAKQLGPNGVLASAVDSDSFVMDYQLLSTANDDAVIAYAPTSDFVVRVQRFDRQGNPVWGQQGVTLTATGEQGFAPIAVACDDGAIVVAWVWEGPIGSGMALQRLDADGNAMWPTPVRVPDPAGKQITLSKLVASQGGDVMVGWIQSRFSTPGDGLVQRFDRDGHPVWAANVKLNRAEQLLFLSPPLMTSDGDGGVYAAWSTALDAFRAAGYVQHIARDGSEQWQPGGVRLVPSAATSQFASAIARAGDRVIVSWKETDAGQNLAGLHVQAFDPAGQRLFEAGGLPLIAAGRTQGALAAAIRPTANGAAVFHAFGPVNSLAVRTGVFSLPLVAPPAPVSTTLSDVSSEKSHPDVSALVGGGYWLVWEDRRGGDGDVWGAWWRAP